MEDDDHIAIALNALFSGDNATFKSAIDDALDDRATAAIGAVTPAVAASLFTRGDDE